MVKDQKRLMVDELIDAIIEKYESSPEPESDKEFLEVYRELKMAAAFVLYLTEKADFRR